VIDNLHDLGVLLHHGHDGCHSGLLHDHHSSTGAAQGLVRQRTQRRQHPKSLVSLSLQGVDQCLDQLWDAAPRRQRLQRRWRSGHRPIQPGGEPGPQRSPLDSPRRRLHGLGAVEGDFFQQALERMQNADMGPIALATWVYFTPSQDAGY